MPRSCRIAGWCAAGLAAGLSLAAAQTLTFDDAEAAPERGAILAATGLDRRLAGARRQDPAPGRISIARADLDGDGRPDAIIAVDHPAICGGWRGLEQGCLWVVALARPPGFQVVLEANAHELFLGTGRTGGLRDLVLRNRREPSRSLVWDGAGYVRRR